MTVQGGPLNGVTVVDFTQFLAGPYASQILGDLDARVIKIEPLEPELARCLPPHFFKGESAYFLSINRNKESLSLDLRSPAGRAAMLAIVEKADIVLENFRPGVAKRLGIDFDHLRTLNPRLIMGSISGFGQYGPYRDHPAYDIVVQAMSGGMSITGEKGGEVVRSGLPLGDVCAGMYAVIGLLAALTEVRRTGVGTYVDIAMLDCQVAMLSYQAAYQLLSGVTPGPQGKSHDSIPTYRSFRCSDGAEVVVAANTERMWKGLCAALGLDALPGDPRFALNADRYLHRADLDVILEARFAERPAGEVLADLIRHEVPSAKINTLDLVVADPQVEAREMVLELEDRDGDIVRVAGNPLKISGYEAPRAFPPALGEHSWAILREFAGLSEEYIRELVRDGVVRSTEQGQPSSL